METRTTAIRNRGKKKHPNKLLEIWFLDEARFGQQGCVYRIWSERGSRTRVLKQMGFKFTYLLGAVNPQTGEHIGLVFSTLDTDVVSVFLQVERVWHWLKTHKLGNRVFKGIRGIFKVESNAWSALSGRAGFTLGLNGIGII